MAEQAVRKFGKGQVIFQEGAEAREMYIVRSGRVRIAKKVDNKTVELGTFGPSEFFGEMAILTGGARSAVAVAIEDTEVLVIGREEFLTALEDGPSWIGAMIRGMAQRLQRMDERLGKDLIYAKRSA